MKLTPTLRKAAILISSLDARSADALLEQMGETMAQRVRNAVMQLDDIDPREQEQIINEFLGSKGGSRAVDDGIELAGSLAQRLPQTSAKYEPAAPLAANEPAPRPFTFLADAPSEVVARHLQREHPQTAAVVLAHLPPLQAAAVVRHLPSDLRADVLLRIGELEETDVEVLRELERGLEAALSPELSAKRKKGQGVATLEAILNAAGESAPVARSAEPAPTKLPTAPQFTPGFVEQRVVSKPQAVQTPEPSRSVELEFAQLYGLDDRSWARILATADPQVALLALAGATTELVDRLMRQLSPQEAKVIRRKMEQLGAVRLRDIERAQQQLARIAARLAAQGEIKLPAQRPFATAA